MPLTTQRHYDIAARTITGSREEKLSHLDAAIQEVLVLLLSLGVRPAHAQSADLDARYSASKR